MLDRRLQAPLIVTKWWIEYPTSHLKIVFKTRTRTAKMQARIARRWTDIYLRRLTSMSIKDQLQKNTAWSKGQTVETVVTHSTKHRRTISSRWSTTILWWANLMAFQLDREANTEEKLFVKAFRVALSIQRRLVELHHPSHLDRRRTSLTRQT